MKTYTIVPVKSEWNWDQIPSFDVNEICWLPDVGIGMTQQICYDESAIYVRQAATESNIRAEHNDPLAQVCEDSCMEFFFSPMAEDVRYFNFEWNLNGCLYLGFRTDRELSMRLQPKSPVEDFDFQANRTESGWEIFYKIPLSFIRLFFPEFQLRSGATIRANCYKCGDKTAAPHYLSWNPSTSPVPDFHRPQDFGQMILG